MNQTVLIKALQEQNLSGEEILAVLTKYSALSEHRNGDARYSKDTMPAGGFPPPGGRMLDGGPFSIINETVFNGLPITRGGDKISQWIPSGKMTSRKKDVQHLEFIVPKDYDPETQTYGEYLAGLNIGECGYGPAATWSGFRYSVEGGTFSVTTDMLKQIESGGLPYHESMPLSFGYDLIGADGSVMRLDDDADWALALAIMMAEEHLNYVTTFGYRENSIMEWDGVLAIVTNGYVDAHAVGRGIPHWANPLIRDGAAIVTPAEALSEMYMMVTYILNRAQMKNWPILPGDIVFYMSASMWDLLAAHIASGALEDFQTSYNFTGGITIDSYLNRLEQVRTGGFGYGVVSINSFPVYVITNNNMGVNSTITISASPAAAITSDILFLTRQAGSFQLWSHDFLDYADLGGPSFENETFSVQNGYGKAGYITEANKCFYYYMEMMGRLSCNMLPLQGRITSVSLPTGSVYSMEAPGFYSPEFYPYIAKGSLNPLG